MNDNATCSFIDLSMEVPQLTVGTKNLVAHKAVWRTTKIAPSGSLDFAEIQQHEWSTIVPESDKPLSQ